VQQPYEFGYRSITLLSKVIAGDRSDIPASHQLFVPTRTIRADNVDEFRSTLNQLRGR
jgi:ribose transport system substrate-binding protein